MLSEKNSDSNSQHEIDTDYLLSLCRELVDELTELRLYISLVYSAWTVDDTTLKPSDDWFFDSDAQLEKIHFLLTLFCNRFSAKDVRELGDNADKIYQLVLENTKHSGSKK